MRQNIHRFQIRIGIIGDDTKKLIEHSQEFERLYKILTKNEKSTFKYLSMPRVLQIMQKCVEHGVQDSLLQRLHFNDLYVLCLSFDIQNMRQAIRNRQKTNAAKRGVTVRDVEQNDAIKFLTGGN